ncbi:MAG: DUF2325 domain-containing protein [Ammonifex sp.]|jgi:hypothetical protein|nr:MAG: DUF2325 domain-containing protein [Ammonifex sp.]
MSFLPVKIHVQLFFERTCQKCRQLVRVMVHDYGELTPEEADRAFGLHDFTVYPLRCPECGTEEFPMHIVGVDALKNAEIFRTRIGTADLPVVGGDTPYAVVRSLEEMAEYERGLAKLADLFKEKETEFWKSFTSWAAEDWPNRLKELSKIELSLGLSAVGKPAPPEMSAAAHRQHALKLRDDEICVFWRAANRHLIEKEFLFDPPDFWNTEAWAREYGRERVLWVLLNFPLPEKLERWRTEKLAPLIKKKSGALWERVRQLGQALDKQRRRAEELSRTVFDLRQEIACLQEKLSAEREERHKLLAEVGKLRQAETPAERDRAKLDRYKALVKELQEETKRLYSLLPETVSKESVTEEPQTEAVTELPDPRETLSGKIVAAFGFAREPWRDSDAQILWHHGDKWDAEAERLAKEADVLVVLTRFCSHEAMWAAKEFAADTGKPVGFARGGGAESVLLAAQNAFRTAIPPCRTGPVRPA